MSTPSLELVPVAPTTHQARRRRLPPSLIAGMTILAVIVLLALLGAGTSTGTAWWAHLGGFASGLALAPVLRPRRRWSR